MKKKTKHQNANDSAATAAPEIALININCSHKNYVDAINVIVFHRNRSRDTKSDFISCLSCSKRARFNHLNIYVIA